MGGRDPVDKMHMKFYRDFFPPLLAARIHKWGPFVRIKKSFSTQRWTSTTPPTTFPSAPAPLQACMQHPGWGLPNLCPGPATDPSHEGWMEMGSPILQPRSHLRVSISSTLRILPPAGGLHSMARCKAYPKHGAAEAPAKQFTPGHVAPWSPNPPAPYSSF